MAKSRPPAATSALAALKGDCDRRVCITGIAAGLLLFAGSFRQLFSLTLFAEWLFYLLVTTTIFIFRRREPDVLRPYRV